MCIFFDFVEIEVVHDFFSWRGKGTSCFFFCSNWLKYYVFGWLDFWDKNSDSGKLQTKSGPNPRRKKTSPAFAWSEKTWNQPCQNDKKCLAEGLKRCKLCFKHALHAKCVLFFLGGWTGLTGFCWPHFLSRYRVFILASGQLRISPKTVALHMDLTRHPWWYHRIVLDSGSCNRW